MALNVSPYSSVQNGYQTVMGSVPSPYSQPLNLLRSGPGNTSVNPDGSMSSEDRIAKLANKQYEKWAAQNMFRERQDQEIQSATDAALQGMQGQRFDNYSFVGGGKGSVNSNPFNTFMSSQGAAGLFGGSVSSPSQRYNQWNNQIVNQNQQFQQRMTPVWQKYGMSPINNAIATPW